MVRRCYVKGCGYSFKPAGTVSFHALPKSKPDLLKKWIKFLGFTQDSLYSTKSVTICSNHFKENDYKQFTNNKVLLPNAVPSINANIKIATPSQDKELNRLCRFCGGYFQNDLINIFGFNENMLLLKIQKYLPSLQVFADDGLPPTICVLCMQALNSFEAFYSRAEESKRSLRKMLNLSETNIEKKTGCQENDIKPVFVKNVEVKFDNSKSQTDDYIIYTSFNQPVIKLESPPKTTPQKTVPPKPRMKSKNNKAPSAPAFKNIAKKYSTVDGYFKCSYCEKMKFISKKALNNHIKYSCVKPIKELKVP